MQPETAILALQVVNLAFVAGVFFRLGRHDAKLGSLCRRVDVLEGRANV